jgi:hypothetical protein
MTQYRISFDLDNDQWMLEKWDREAEEWELEQDVNALSRGISANRVTFRGESDSAPDGFSTEAAAEITFNSRGFPIDGADIVYLANEEEDYAVTTSLSGKIQLWRYEDDAWVTK